MATAAPNSGGSYAMVAAIDFGTTASGYAYSFKTSPTDIKINKNWSETFGFLSYKTPTTVLLKGSRLEFDSFGYEAEYNYAESVDEDEPYVKTLYRHFKMIANRVEKLTLKRVVISTDGQITPAIDIFTHALRYLKEHLLLQLSQELGDLPDPNLIRWVITVPAIWSEESKNFMREAAFRSGCIKEKNSRQLVIALEPEAASFFCRQLDLVPFTGEKDMSFPRGTKYLVLDCGGGTNDMVVHEVVLDFKVKEVVAVTGGAHGGITVDVKFISVLKAILGDEFIETFKNEFPAKWFSFMNRFEHLKKVAKHDGKPKRMEMPYVFAEIYSIMRPGRTLNDAFSADKATGIRFKDGDLIFSNDFIKSIFQDTIDNIAKGVRGIFSNPKIHPLKYIFMVGGFCESPFLQAAIKSEFGSTGCKVVVPNEAQLAIIKGAVLFGHHQDRVVSRVARKTYGLGTSRLFDPKIHDSSKRYTRPSDGKDHCHLFEPLVVIDEETLVGVSKEFPVCLPPNQRSGSVTFYSLSRKPHKPVEYQDAPDLHYLAVITVTRPEHDNMKDDRYYTVKMTFGNTEILAEVIDRVTGEAVSATLEFFND